MDHLKKIFLYVTVVLFVWPGLAAAERKGKINWLYVSAGTLLDRWQGKTLTSWESRVGRPYPPANTPPQNFYGINIGAMWQWHFNLKTGVHLNLFYNRIGTYEAYQSGYIVTLEDGVAGMGDIWIQNVFNLKLIPGEGEVNFYIPGIYQKSNTNISPQGTTVDPWTGLGAYHLGIAYQLNFPKFYGYIYGKWALPSGRRSQVEVGDQDIGARVELKHQFGTLYQFKAGLLSEYRSYHWKQLTGDLRRDFSVSPVLVIGHPVKSNSEISLSMGFSAFSWIDDSLLDKPLGKVFFGIYYGIYL
ncbi:MAG: hypothetical protein HQK83_01795 [Fibrobacteria bacterium]|nr:hypothetical protein [Fibrobacteria bacterium]